MLTPALKCRARPRPSSLGPAVAGVGRSSEESAPCSDEMVGDERDRGGAAGSGSISRRLTPGFARPVQRGIGGNARGAPKARGRIAGGVRPEGPKPPEQDRPSSRAPRRGAGRHAPGRRTWLSRGCAPRQRRKEFSPRRSRGSVVESGIRFLQRSAARTLFVRATAAGGYLCHLRSAVGLSRREPRDEKQHPDGEPDDQEQRYDPGKDAVPQSQNRPHHSLSSVFRLC